MKTQDNKVLHLTAIPLRCIAAGELDRQASTKAYRQLSKSVANETDGDPRKHSPLNPASPCPATGRPLSRERGASASSLRYGQVAYGESASRSERGGLGPLGLHRAEGRNCGAGRGNGEHYRNR